MKLGKITTIDPRSIWKSESADFTPWLAQEENISQLGEAINLDLEVESQEKNVGPFRADILARDTSGNHYVLIENQLEATDHKHLGQIMTYAAGLDAFSIIWIAQSFTEEHRAALDWLNRITDENINFFGIEIEVIQIGDSVPAPQFKVVAKPNDWSRSVKKSADNNELSDIKAKQLAYWTDLKAYVESLGNPFKMRTPKGQHWSSTSIGTSKYTLEMSVNSQEDIIQVSLWFKGDKAKEHFDALYAKYQKDAADKISDELEWLRMDDNKFSKIILTSHYDFLDPETKQEQFDWFVKTMTSFNDFFRPLLPALK